MKKPRKPKQSSAKSESSEKKRQPLSVFARGLSSEWRRLQLPRVGEPVVVAVSGGADSVALFLALDELIRADKLSVQIVVAHLNHKLRGPASDEDARWVAALAKQLGH